MEPTIEEVVPAKPEKAKKVEKSLETPKIAAQESLAQLVQVTPDPLAALEDFGWQKISSQGDSNMSAYDIDGVGCLVEVTRGANSNLVFVPGARVAVKNGAKYLRN